MAKNCAEIAVFGIVQGVGFRPFIHKLVNEYKLKGWVQNSSSGVNIEVEGEEDDIMNFIEDIRFKSPSLSLIEKIDYRFSELKNYKGFKIIQSDSDKEGFVLISPDVSTCDDCLNDLMDPQNKRYRYPFTNCTNCGPRFTIIRNLPYDRCKTTMSEFPMCMDCDSEYHDIEDRRYHAQPNCCPECGPQVELRDSSGKVVEGDAIKAACDRLSRGFIVAVKGLGGFHLSCDAQNIEAIRALRYRKHRESKPFALMCRDIDGIKRYAHVSEEEEKILNSNKRPIVLLKKKDTGSLPLEASRVISPDNDYIGFMLPYTPLHYLLFDDEKLKVLVMTSANVSDNPVIYKNGEAFDVLGHIADYFLIHNRDIETRCDDSVVKIVDGSEYFIRRSRGYAPFPIKLGMELKPILACGAEQKASFALSKGKYVFQSQHIGDLKNLETLIHFENQIENFKRLFKIEPEIAACDMHPDYMSTGYAAGKTNIPVKYIQHHHAHMASCMADNNLEGEVIGICWDGTGLGTDGTAWGGEILTGGYSGFQRRGTFLGTPLPGGDLSVKKISHMAASYLITTYGGEFFNKLDKLPHVRNSIMNPELIYQMVEKRINSPLTSSCGRLFDGVSALLGLCSTADYEGQGAIRLEKHVDFSVDNLLNFLINFQQGLYIFNWQSTIDDVINLFISGKDTGYISSAFHNTLVEAAIKMCCLIRNDTGLDTVVLSGGVFQNSYILQKMIPKLKKSEFDVYIHRRVAANDEGISLGQLMIAQNGGGFDVPCSTF